MQRALSGERLASSRASRFILRGQVDCVIIAMVAMHRRAHARRCERDAM
jgi:hypothetical protein